MLQLYIFLYSSHYCYISNTNSGTSHNSLQMDLGPSKYIYQVYNSSTTRIAHILTEIPRSFILHFHCF